MSTKSEKYTSNAVALIIGVNDYSAFDSEGKSNLRGSLNDVDAVVDFCKWRLGMDTHHVKFLEDPTEAEILEKVKWLKEELSAGDKQGLFWYSGHGAHTEKQGLLLCPTNTTATFENTVAFKELGRHLGTKAAKNLTVVLDCCHGGTSTDALGRPTTTLGGPILAKELNSSDLKIGSVVLTACAVGEQAQQSRFGGKWHGAFTWALLSVASQWQRMRQGANLRLDLTYRELIKKATVLLDALEFQASPQVYPRTAGALSVMQMGEMLLSTSVDPDGNRGGIQLDPNQKWYKLGLFDTKSAVLGQWAIMTTTADGNGYKANYEYWYTTPLTGSKMFDKLGSASSIVFVGENPNPLPRFNPDWELSCAMTWTAMSAAPTGKVFVTTKDDSGNYYGISLPEKATSGKPTWYLYTADVTKVPSYVASRDVSRTMTVQASLPSEKNYKWYQFSAR